MAPLTNDERLFKAPSTEILKRILIYKFKISTQYLNNICIQWGEILTLSLKQINSINVYLSLLVAIEF